MTDSYHPIFTLMIVVGPALGYMFAVDRIKNAKKEKKEEIEGTKVNFIPLSLEI